MAADERLVAGITEFITMNAEALMDIKDAMSVTESFRIRDSRELESTGELADEFGARRRDTRSSTAEGLLEECRSVTEIGRAFGVSHQLASRFVKSRLVDAGD